MKYFLLLLTTLHLFSGEVIDHPVSTSNPEAQKRFNLGLTYIYAYNHDYAYRQFEKAAELDPSLAMAYWGMALALGQNINEDVTPENEKTAYNYSQKALSLSKNASPVEQDYIKALVQRYTNDLKTDLVKLRFIYRDAMKKVAEKYTEDLDAATLYAESILNLDPWKYWTWDGKPRDGTLEAISVLKSVLDRNPYHVGANHYFIHAWEESETPEQALISAFRLSNLNLEAGHLLHMPCHIFILCGYYKEAIETSKRAIEADKKYIQQYGNEGYPLHYLSHNLKILTRAYMLAEDYENAIKTGMELTQYLLPYYEGMPHLSKFMITPVEINLYFYKWNEVLELPMPPTKSPFVLAFWHFGRALANFHLGNSEAFKKEKEEMLAFKQKIPQEEEIANNKASNIIDLAELVLDAGGDIELLKKAVDWQDRFYYDEPPPWYISLRIELGNALLKEKRYQDAEVVFKKALSEQQRNGRLLDGLYESLKGQRKDWDAGWVKRETSIQKN